jgi:type I restriction enzyme M protein
MANELRGNMDAAEYKNYILAFMFYRYLSEHQERYLVENNVIDVAADESINQAYLEPFKGSCLVEVSQGRSNSLVKKRIRQPSTWLV